jgi:hypothetical protein
MPPTHTQPQSLRCARFGSRSSSFRRACLSAGRRWRVHWGVVEVMVGHAWQVKPDRHRAGRDEFAEPEVREMVEARPQLRTVPAEADEPGECVSRPQARLSAGNTARRLSQCDACRVSGRG